MSICAALFSACCGLAVWVGSGGLIRNNYVRALLVALALLPPAGGLETVVSATNVAWNGAFGVLGSCSGARGPPGGRSWGR